jgi:tRNA acetyltransferase TAN1
MKGHEYKNGEVPSIDTLIDAPDLLATSDIWSMSAACSELWMLLRAVGDEAPTVYRTKIRGLIAAETKLNPLEAICRLREELMKNPEVFKNLLRIIPIETTVTSELETIVEASLRLSEKIQGEQSFRITLEKRRTELKRMEVIEAIAEGIDRKVDLEEPDWIILVQIVGKRTGIAVVPSDGIISVQKERLLYQGK